VLASLACVGQLAWSGTVEWSVGFTAMTGIHMLIGLGEGLISALAFLAIARTRPELVSSSIQNPASSRIGGVVGIGLVISIGLAVFVAPFACPWPDGLERVAAKLGFEHKAGGRILPALLTDYALPGCKSAAVGTAVAGAAGALVVFGLALLLSRALVPRRVSGGRELTQSSGC
jgi:cobalt/nickel transport system permease protein